MELHTRDPEMVYRLPVVISENVNHAQFASGPMPLRVRREDIPAEIPPEEAYEKLAKVSSDFILIHTPNLNDAESKEQAKFDIETAVAETDSFLQPIFTARGMEEKRKIRSYKYSEWLNTAQVRTTGNTELLICLYDWPIRGSVISRLFQGGYAPAEGARRD